jgi:phage major head subunit gpT-like protein
MEVTQASLDAIRVQVEMGFQSAFSTAEPWYPKISTKVPSSTRSNLYPFIAQQLKMRRWIGPRVAQNLSERVYQLFNQKFEGTVELDRDDVKFDNLGMFQSQVVPQLGFAAKKHPDSLALDILVNNSATAFDGLPLFSNAHLTYNGTGTYSNDFTTAPFSAANFNAAWAAMTAYTGEDGTSLGITPNLVIGGSLMKLPFLQVLNATNTVQTVVGTSTTNITTAAAVDNQLKGWADMLIIPEMTGTSWYLADTSKGIMPLIYQENEAPFIRSRDNLLDPKVFDQDMFTYGVDYSGAVGVSLPFLISRNTP